MKQATVNKTYNVLAFDEDLTVVNNDNAVIEIDQFKGDTLEVWKTREKDGFIFVYCKRMGIGYWVIPSHIDIQLTK